MATPREPIVPEGARRGGPPGRAERATDEASQAADRSKEELKDTAREVKDSVREATARVRIEARETAEEVKNAAEEQVETQKSRAAGKAHAIARALREAGETLEGEGESELARYGRESADQVERVADYLDRNDMHGLVSDLEGTARRNPGAFVGTTFAAGMLLGRFLRSSSPRSDRETSTSTSRGYTADEDVSGSYTADERTSDGYDMPGTTPITTSPAGAASQPDGPVTQRGEAPSRVAPSDRSTTRYVASTPRPESIREQAERSRGSEREGRNG